MKSRLTIAFFGSSLVSSYWNGAATYYRGIIRALHARGHDITFYEPDAYDRQAHRDLPGPPWARVVVYSGADVSKARAIENMVKQTVETFGSVDIMVNNAGIQHVAPIEEFPEEKWDAIMAINLSSAFHATRYVLPHMKRMGWGRIINVASAHALVGSTHRTASWRRRPSCRSVHKQRSRAYCRPISRQSGRRWSWRTRTTSRRGQGQRTSHGAVACTASWAGTARCSRTVAAIRSSHWRPSARSTSRA